VLAEIRAREQETERIFSDQARLRENLKSLKGSAEEQALAQRYTRQLDEQESRLEDLRGKMSQLQERYQLIQSELIRMAEGITLDVRPE